MIIRTAQFNGRWNAGLAQADGNALFPSFVGHGKNQNEAVGDLVCQLAGADDSPIADEVIDVRVASV